MDAKIRSKRRPLEGEPASAYITRAYGDAREVRGTVGACLSTQFTLYDDTGRCHYVFYADEWAILDTSKDNT